MNPASMFKHPSMSHSNIPLDSKDEEYLTKALNTAFVTSGDLTNQASLQELIGLSRGPAFRAILASIHRLSQEMGCSESEAAIEIVQTFRRLDRLWHDYVFNQGIEKLKSKT